MPEAQDQITEEVTSSEGREALETATAARMADVFKDGDDTLSGDETVTPPAEEKPAVARPPRKEADEKTEEKPAEDPEAAASEQEATPTPAATPAKESVPAAYRRSLKAYQWDDKEIDEAFAANPAGFLKTAERIHLNRVEETRRWADLGRQAKAGAPAAKAEEQTAFKPIDIKALRDKYGDEPFVAQLESVNAAIQFLNEKAMPFIQQSQERQRAAELETLGRQVDGFFGSKDMEPYHDHYGKSGATLTEQQLATRQKVLETADLLISGARSMGRNLTLDEALTVAHDSVSGPIREQVATRKIQQQATQRQKALTMRPGTRSAAAQPAGRSALEAKVKTGLAGIFK